MSDLIGTDHAIIVDVRTSAAIWQADAKRMIERTMESFALYPTRLLGAVARPGCSAGSSISTALSRM